MPDCLHLFILVSPAQVYNAESLISSFKSNEDADFVLVNPHSYPIDNLLWNQTFDGTLFMKNDQSSTLAKGKYQYSKISSYRKLANNLFSSLFFNYKTIYVYFPHLEDMLINFIFFKLKTLFPEKVTGRVIEDGILNYYELPFEGNKKTNLWKKALGKISKLPFTFYQGDISGIDLKVVENQYVRAPKLAYNPDKSLQLPIEKVNFKAEKGKTLILGQEAYINIYGIESYQGATKKLVQHILSIIPIDAEIVYKPHRYGKNINNFLKSLLPGKKITFINDESPVEKIVAEIQPEYIISFNSSALLNINLMLDTECLENVQIISFSYYSKSLTPLFIKSGIRVIQ